MKILKNPPPILKGDTLYFKEGIEKITNKDLMKYDCDTSIKHVYVPDGVTEIGMGAFRGMRQLESIRLPESLTYIWSYAFCNCQSLKEIHLSENVTHIGTYAFYRCESLTSVKIPHKVKGISEYCFYDCVSLKNIELNDNITYIEERAFEGCQAMSDIKLPSSLSNIEGYAFVNCSSLHSVELPQNVQRIKNGTFLNCSSLTDVTLSDKTTAIGKYAFNYCPLKELRLTKAIRIIESDNFNDNKNIKIFVESENVPTCTNSQIAYNNKHKSVIIYNINDIDNRNKTTEIINFIKSPSLENLNKAIGTIYKYIYDRTIPFAIAYYDYDNFSLFLKDKIKEIFTYISCSDDLKSLDFLIKKDFFTLEDIEKGIEIASQNEKYEMFVSLVQVKNEMSGYDIEDERFDL